tara:strand:- start:11497 stop:13425 length:1929 start_codon:yes stop_codon:yes gene_type:complete
MGKKDLVDGTVYLNNSGKGFLRASGDKSYSLPKREMFKVFPGDKVKCIIKASDRAKIIEVTERNTKEVKGILDFQKKKYCLNSVDGSYHLNIIIDSKASKSKKVGDIYNAKIIKQPSLKFKPTARLIDTKSFENPFEEASEMALSGSDIPVDWPKDVISQTNRLDSSFLDSNKSLRRDLRNLSFVTIDGRTAKDFDDAIFASENKNDFKLIVAIADVAEFVKFNSPLDLEAKNRATSVYFNHKVIPMLPEKLSNDLCSLRPNEDRLTMSCEITLDKEGVIKNYEIFNSIIRSQARLTYEKIGKQFELDKPSLSSEVNDSITALEKIYRLLHEKRKKRLAIDFDLPEYNPISDKNNRIKKFGLTERNHAHQLVEECMILANVCAAELLHKAKIPSLFRSHEKPDPLKISNLKDFLTSRQITNNMNSPKVRENIVSWLKAAENKKNKEIINIQILRSMSLARYDALETSHFALSLDKYTHFTSPIRRYADLVVHRGLKELIKQNLNTSKSSKKFSKSNEFFYSRDLVNEIAEEVSEKDRRAEKSCRKAEKFLRCKCAENYIGKEFNGVMVSAFEFGIFVRLENLNIEGFIHVSKLSKKDFFNFEESTMSMKSARSKRSISIGDNLIVKIQSVESYKGRVNLIMT